MSNDFINDVSAKLTATICAALLAWVAYTTNETAAELRVLKNEFAQQKVSLTKELDNRRLWMVSVNEVTKNHEVRIDRLEFSTNRRNN